MSKEAEHDHKLINQSGFTLQMVLEQILSKNKFRVLPEHMWKNEDTGDSGYADLLAFSLDDNTRRFVIECKKSSNSPWLFPIEQSHQDKQIESFRCLTSDAVDDGEIKNYWQDAWVSPVTYESQYCIIRGQDDSRSPLLERYAGDLLAATESIASDRVEAKSRRKNSRTFWYIPIIVTLADLRACFLKLDDFDFVQAELPIKSIKSESVDFIRFRKTLPSTTSLAEETVDNSSLSSIRKLNERSIFIVRAEALLRFLKGFQLSWH